MTPAEQVQSLTDKLNLALAQKAQIDEQISVLRNTIAGVNLGISLQKAAKDEPTD